MVHDANVLVDLEKAALLEVWFQLGIETHTSDFVVAELEEERQPNALAHIKSGQIVCHETSGEELKALIGLRSGAGRGLSIEDCSVLYVVGSVAGSVLITGDGALRKVAEEMRIEVHGLLWIMDLLVKKRLLRPIVAAAKLEHLVETGSRLPAEACRKRIQDWRQLQ